MKKYFYIAALIIAVAACKTMNPDQAEESALKWDQTGKLVFKSHSVLTTDAVKKVNAELQKNQAKALEKWLPTLNSESRYLLPNFIRKGARMGSEELYGGFYPERHLDDPTGRSQNRLQEGHVAADFPSRLYKVTWTKFLFDDYCNFMAKSFDFEPSVNQCSKLPDSGFAMALHFTRQYTEVKDAGGEVKKVELTSAKKTCEKSIDLIKGLSKKAYHFWKEGRRLTKHAEQADYERNGPMTKTYKELAMKNFERMYFFMGIASHALQDSFAPPHAQRNKEDPRILEDLCYYYDNEILPPDQAGACVHAVGAGREPRDNIYYPGNSVSRKLAADATYAYLYGFATFLLDEVATSREDSSKQLDDFLDSFLNDRSKFGMGYLSCGSLN